MVGFIALPFTKTNALFVGTPEFANVKVVSLPSPVNVSNWKSGALRIIERTARCLISISAPVSGAPVNVNVFPEIKSLDKEIFFDELKKYFYCY